MALDAFISSVNMHEGTARESILPFFTVMDKNLIFQASNFLYKLD